MIRLQHIHNPYIYFCDNNKECFCRFFALQPGKIHAASRCPYPASCGMDNFERGIGMVEIKNLTRFYGNIPAVKNLSFTVEDGEILGFLGPNGAGKSTTMNMITGYLPSSSGTVVVDGFDIAQQPEEVKKRIGYLPELPPLYLDMRVKEYLRFVAGIKGVKRKDVKAQIDQAMERLKLTDVQHRLIRNLSKGYKQRVGFAQALLGNPKILILDEPTVGLDPSQVAQVRQLILDLKKDHTIIFSSHILSEVSAVCERVVIINKGEIKAIDTIENLENSIQANLSLSITVEGDKAKVEQLIQAVPGVVAIKSAEYIKTGTHTFTVEIRDDSVRKAILAKLIEADCSVVSVNTSKMSLEEVFLKLTAQNTGKKSLEEIFDEIGEDMDRKESEAAAERENKTPAEGEK